MVFDIDMIKRIYSLYPTRIEAARKLVGRPLTLTEKILYTHLWEGNATEAYTRGNSYVDFAPDRVAMQDATAQMALLQFMQAGKRKSPFLPQFMRIILSKQNLVQPKTCKNRSIKTTKFLIFYPLFPINTGSDFGSQEQALSIKLC